MFLTPSVPLFSPLNFGTSVFMITKYYSDARPTDFVEFPPNLAKRFRRRVIFQLSKPNPGLPLSVADEQGSFCLYSFANVKTPTTNCFHVRF